MAEPFLGEIRLFGAGIVPTGWMACEGQTVAIAQNQALFSILGNQFGGDGVSTFKLPDLRGRVPMGVSNQYPQGSSGGEATHALTQPEIPMHTHQVFAASAAASNPVIANDYWASLMSYDSSKDTTMAASAISTAGTSAPHNNMQPYMAINFCIAISGIYPSRP
jgi:microcystin-dependent protein